jgi:lysophospholipase L1-like esterase
MKMVYLSGQQYTSQSKMKNKKRIGFIFFLFIILGKADASYAQRFYQEVSEMLKKEKYQSVDHHPILFAGSSSFTKWQNVQDYFPGHPILNRGFGGSTLQDQIHYSDSIYFNIEPRQIVIYCGENDLAETNNPSGEVVFKRFRHLYRLIRSHFPKVPVVYISMKPSPSRRHLFPAIKDANCSIHNFLTHKNRGSFIDVFPLMLGDDGEPIKDIFIEDNLHMNSKGYEIWRKVIEPMLL